MTDTDTLSALLAAATSDDATTDDVTALHVAAVNALPALIAAARESARLRNATNLTEPAILLRDDEESVERLAAALHFDWCPDKEIRPDHQPGSVDVGQAKRLIEALRR